MGEQKPEKLVFCTLPAEVSAEWARADSNCRPTRCKRVVIDGFHIDDAYGSAVQFTYGGSGTDIVRNVQLMNGFIRTGAINRGGISLSLPSTNIAQDIDISNIAVYGDDSATDVASDARLSRGLLTPASPPGSTHPILPPFAYGR